MKIRSIGGKIFDGFITTFMVFFCITILYPFWQQVALSISSPAESSVISLHLFVKEPTLDSYKRLFFSGNIGKAYYFTVMRTIIGTFLTVTISSMLAYPLSKKGLWGRKVWMGLIVFTMFFSGGLVPTYILVRNLHLMNTIWSLVIPGLCSAWNIVIIRNFFSAIPEEVEESAKIDGANDLLVFFKIVLPLSTPILATVTLWTMVGHWNSWFDAMIYVTGQKIIVLQILLRQILAESVSMSGMSDILAKSELERQGQQYNPESIKAAMLLVATLPILCVYPFLQKYFVKGIMVGAVKG